MFFEECVEFTYPCSLEMLDEQGLLEITSDSSDSYLSSDCLYYQRFRWANCPESASRITIQDFWGTAIVIYIRRSFGAGIFHPTINNKLVSVEVYNMSGISVLFHPFDEISYDRDAFSFLHQNLPSGIYILAMKYEEEVVYQKIGLNYEY